MNNDRWCAEYYINQKTRRRDEYLYVNYPYFDLNEMADKLHITPLYILFILCRMGAELLPEHKKMLEPYVNKNNPFPKYGKGFIYVIKNVMDSYVYIGQTNQTLLMRFKQHLREYKESVFAGRKLHQHFCLLGTDKFYIELIEEVDLKDLNEREKYWIKEYDSFNNGLNGTEGGDYDRQEFF